MKITHALRGQEFMRKLTTELILCGLRALSGKKSGPIFEHAHKKSRPGQGRLRMGLVKDTPFVISEAPFTSGGEWTKFYRRRQTTANGDDFQCCKVCADKIGTMANPIGPNVVIRC
jgi:hypothetical protein